MNTTTLQFSPELLNSFREMQKLINSPSYQMALQASKQLDQPMLRFMQSTEYQQMMQLFNNLQALHIRLDRMFAPILKNQETWIKLIAQYQAPQPVVIDYNEIAPTVESLSRETVKALLQEETILSKPVSIENAPKIGDKKFSLTTDQIIKIFDILVRLILGILAYEGATSSADATIKAAELNYQAIIQSHKDLTNKAVSENPRTISEDLIK